MAAGKFLKDSLEDRRKKKKKNVESTSVSTPSADGGSSSNSSSSTRRSTTSSKQGGGDYSTYISHSRVLFVVVLAGVAALLGYASHKLLTEAEITLAREQFDAIAERALDLSLDIATRKKRGIITLTSIIEQTFPNSDTWPFIHFNGFEVISNEIIKTATGDSMGLLPIVTPDQKEDFEEFARMVYPQFPNVMLTGLDENKKRYNETTGETYWNSPYKLFLPFFYHSKGPLLLLSNYHSVEERGKELDDVIACSDQRAQEIMEMELASAPDDSDAAAKLEEEPRQCSSVTGILDLSFRKGQEFQPASVLYQPIYPANNRSVLTGFVTSTIKWHETLFNVFSGEVSGVDCVLRTETQVYTYVATDGVITLRGEGDLHNPEYSDHGQTVTLTSLYSNNSPNYTLALYPNEDFFAIYATGNADYATIGAVLIVILTACIFFLYDMFVRKEFNHKKALDQARRRFVRFISHEVRTPLNAVCMGLQLQQDETSRLSTSMEQLSTPREELQEQATELSTLNSDILQNATSAVGVLNDLLNYDKVESGKLSLELTVVKIWELVEQTFGEFRQQAKFNNINYILDLSAFNQNDNDDDDEAQTIPVSAAQLPQDVRDSKVVGDKIRISQVLRNLISNAIKFSKDGGSLTVRPLWKPMPDKSKEKVEITLHSGEVNTYERRGDLQVEVEDNGSGMTEEQLKRLFGEGVQFNVNELQAGQGSGLGLFIAKGIIEKHGGSLVASSEGIGCGTTFTMTIPLYFVPDPPQQQESPECRGMLGANPHGLSTPLNILVVDDTTMNRKILARLLKNKGHICEQAEDGAIAVEKVTAAINEGRHFDSILMDYEMPNLNGPDATKEIRRLGSDSFIVGVTGNLFPEDVTHFKACGANLVLPKPLDVQVLLDTFVEHGLFDPPTPCSSSG